MLIDEVQPCPGAQDVGVNRELDSNYHVGLPQFQCELMGISSYSAHPHPLLGGRRNGDTLGSHYLNTVLNSTRTPVTRFSTQCVSNRTPSSALNMLLLFLTQSPASPPYCSAILPASRNTVPDRPPAKMVPRSAICALLAICFARLRASPLLPTPPMKAPGEPHKTPSPQPPPIRSLKVCSPASRAAPTFSAQERPVRDPQLASNW